MTPGYKTVGFWAVALVTVASALLGSGAVMDTGVAGQWAASLVAALSAAGYSSVRVFEKGGLETAPPWKRTEFWVSLVTACAMLVVAAFGEGSRAAGYAAAVIAAAGYLGRHELPPKAGA